jgi:hypothetical protein
MDPRHYFVVVASRGRVAAAAAGGYVEISQGRASPLGRLREGDLVVFYSPRETDPGGSAVQPFTAIAEVAAGPAFEGEPRHESAERPLRRGAHYWPTGHAPIRPLLEALDFIRDKKHWGVSLRHGFVQMSAADFRHIAQAMGCEQDAQRALATGTA